MDPLEDLADRIREQIPLTAHLGVRLAALEETSLCMEAPLEPNINDKGTMFAGSQAALLALGGWALTTLLGEAECGRLDVLAVRSQLQYLAPLAGPADIRVSAAEEDVAAFRRRLNERGRARLTIQARAIGPDDVEAARYDGEYLARR